jgi:hypothetical protein
MPEVESKYELPSEIAPFFGKINDFDAHEATPTALWREIFGEDTEELRRATAVEAGKSAFVYNPDAVSDDTEINAHNVWHTKMEKAPGAFDVGRRLSVLDFLGIKQQIVFPGVVGLAGIYLHNMEGKTNEGFSRIKTEHKAYARRLIQMHNDWCCGVWSGNKRIHPVAILLEDTPEEMYATLQSLVRKGIRFVELSVAVPPAGVSPAAATLDGVWALGAEANVAFTLHVDGSSVHKFVATREWKNARAFEGWRVGDEFELDPWTLTNLHLAAQNFISTMILGGVFDRHPALHVGAQEFGAHWVGPLAECMDSYYQNTPFPVDLGERKLKLKPSEYLSRNFRVSPFQFEPVGKYIDRFGLEDVYCFASDFPHPEGGKRPIEDFVKSLKPHGERVLRKFFIENAELLMP